MDLDETGAEGGPPRCGEHPARVAEHVCEHCGTFGCGACMETLRGRTICKTCVDEGRVSTYGVPWDRRHELGAFVAWKATMSEVLKDPSDFFSRVDPAGKAQEPALFAAMTCVPAGLLLFVMYALIAVFTLFTEGGVMTALVVLAMALLYAAIFPAMILASTLAMGLVQHGALLVLGGGKNGLNTTLRGDMYAMAPYIAGTIPCIGIFAAIWVVGLQGVAFHKMHDDTPLVAGVAAILPLGVCFSLTLALMIVAAMLV